MWLSEVMLQQTRIATVYPYYRSFLARFPTLAALASAREADVLAAWAGLGYYARARHLREAARLLVREHAGHVPDDPDVFSRLPGVGRYTTGAVLSIAFARPLPAVDGNAARVLSRLFALPTSLRDPRGARTLWALAASLVPMRRPGDWNQALMELGATVCGPRAPRCTLCPLRGECRALARGRVRDFPPPRPARAGARVWQAVALVVRRGRLLVVRREGARLAGLWEPPAVEFTGPRPPGAAAERRALHARLAGLGLRARLAVTPATVRCTIARDDIEARVWEGEIAGSVPRSARLRWVDPRAPRLALTALARKAARLIEPRVSGG